ncbi:bacterio-opsin activator domain-containing protein [Halovivax limisalsi]|uniref:bacterio-opsin activator domain-containing protein n=1 Tax=Halovivax limisalsi TaxID=1453760 RepID=UPI001FFCE153|nr:bacterio-opsin activator domain-containing protein [Halovivax limisalsi]
MASPTVEDGIYAETLAVFESAGGDGEPLTTPEVADALGVDRRTVYARLERLADAGELNTKKVGAGGRVWWRPPDSDGAGRPDPFDPDPASAVLEAICHPALATDASGVVTCANEAFCERFDFERDALVGTDFERLADTEAADEGPAIGRSDGVDAETASRRVDLVGGDGTAVPVDVSTFPASTDDGTGTAAIHRLREATDRTDDRSEFAIRTDVQAAVIDIVDSILSCTTRAGIEEAVCTGLAEADAYAAAWIAEVDPDDQTLNPRVEAGSSGYADAVEISIDPSTEIGQGPAGRAVRTRETCVCRDIVADPTFEPWRALARDRGFRSGAAVPIVHDPTLYGTIMLYATREGAFDVAERRLVTQLGEIVGYAIATTERKRAMLSDELVEIGYRSRRFLERVTDGDPVDGVAELERIVPVGDGTYLVYGRARSGGIEAIDRLVEAESAPQFDDYAVLSVDETESHFELRLADPPMACVVSEAGGSFEAARIVDGDLSVTVHLPPGSDIQRVTSAMQAAYPHLEPITRKQRTRRAPETAFDASLLETALTDRQRAALEAGYAAGFFEWPRDSSGKEVAASLDISPATFHQHVRTAERKLLDELFDDRAG